MEPISIERIVALTRALETGQPSPPAEIQRCLGELLAYRMAFGTLLSAATDCGEALGELVATAKAMSNRIVALEHNASQEWCSLDYPHDKD